ncbi:MAG: methyltransferase domain-containing protein [Bacteroidetes bacterium]|nr:methyltransferase domain-containing protein [Bacteroidota bacterium]
MYKIYFDKEALIKAVVKQDCVILDVGFFGQGTSITNPRWVHRLLQKRLNDPKKQLYGIDLDFDRSVFTDETHYKKKSAESFYFDVKFDIIFAGDLIEHIPNPGLFILQCKKSLKPGGQLVITTPNAFNLFNLAEKITKYEPTTNSDHVCYYNSRVLRQFFGKMHMDISQIGYIYTLHPAHAESFNKKVLNTIYFFLSKFTTKFLETLVVVAANE